MEKKKKGKCRSGMMAFVIEVWRKKKGKCRSGMMTFVIQVCIFIVKDE